MATQLDTVMVQTAVQPSSLLLSDEQLAGILLVTADWIRAHAEEIPGFRRLGSYFRFRRDEVLKWLGGSLEPLLDAEGAAALMSVPKSWVYHNADPLPGVLRLGRYVRFRPAIMHGFLAGSEVVQ